jgi:hypothetical protein
MAQAKTDDSKTKALCQHQRQALRAVPEAQPPLVAEDAKGKCVECKADEHRALIYRLKLIGGLLMPFALQALDVTM